VVSFEDQAHSWLTNQKFQTDCKQTEEEADFNVFVLFDVFASCWGLVRQNATFTFL